MNKKGFLARDFITILVLFGLIISIGYFVVADMASPESYNQSVMIDSDFQARYNTLTNVTTDIYQMRDETLSNEGMQVVSTYTTMFKATFTIISIVFGSFDLVDNTLTSIAVDLGIDSDIASLIFGAILSILIAMIVFIIISSISRGRM